MHVIELVISHMMQLASLSGEISETKEQRLILFHLFCVCLITCVFATFLWAVSVAEWWDFWDEGAAADICWPHCCRPHATAQRTKYVPTLNYSEPATMIEGRTSKHPKRTANDFAVYQSSTSIRPLLRVHGLYWHSDLLAAKNMPPLRETRSSTFIHSDIHKREQVNLASILATTYTKDFERSS